LSTPRRHRSLLLPYTTLFRSHAHICHLHDDGRVTGGHDADLLRPDKPPSGFHTFDMTGCGPTNTCYLAVLNDVDAPRRGSAGIRSEEHTSELQSRENLVCRLL